jgi:prepilin-type N-terminal cleavage/methylation domain-containing protein/prepilin-type processing-associated H-X9-DG protein
MRGRAFTLVELLVVITIIALLLALILPAIAGARTQARLVQCASNVRGVCQALLNYAAESKGSFPPNRNVISPGEYWSDEDRIGRYLPNPANLATGVGGGVLVCPDDNGAVRSYSMNFWASAAVDPSAAKLMPSAGVLWKLNVGRGSQMILVVERWSSSGTADGGFYAPPTAGQAGGTPGQRFGVDGGIAPLMRVGRFGSVNCEVAFYRHRKRGEGEPQGSPVGRAQFGYADGHVALKTNGELAVASTGLSTLDSQWSPADVLTNQSAGTGAP